MFYSDDPERDLDRWLAEQDRELEKLPKRADCDNYITDDFYLINDAYICEDCIEHYKVRLEDYVG